MKKSLVIGPDVQKQLRALPKDQCTEIVLRLLELNSVFGKPHEHHGLGIRKLHAELFECRAGLGRRILFRAAPGALIIRFIGNHDEVSKYLRGLLTINR